MKTKNREAVERALGIIEGASFGASQRVQDALVFAIEMIDDALADEESEGGE